MNYDRLKGYILCKSQPYTDIKTQLQYFKIKFNLGKNYNIKTKNRSQSTLEIDAYNTLFLL